MRKETQKEKLMPMTSDELVNLDNREDGEEPESLIKIRQQSPIYLTSLSEQAKSNNLSHISSKVSDRVWQINLDKDFIIGRIGEDITTLSSQRVKDLNRHETKPSIPNWSGMNFHPKLSTEKVVRTFRRNKGERITPHYIFPPADDRQIYYPSGHPWRCVGKIFAWDDPSKPDPAWSGTGALV